MRNINTLLGIKSDVLFFKIKKKLNAIYHNMNISQIQNLIKIIIRSGKNIITLKNCV